LKCNNNKKTNQNIKSEMSSYRETMYNKAPDLRPIARLALLDNANGHNFYECTRSNNRNTEERKRAMAKGCT